MRLMLQAQHVQPAHQPGRPRRRLSQRLPAQERHQQRLLKHQKVLPLQSPQKARRLPVLVRRKRQKRMLQRHKNLQPLLHPPRPRKRQKLPPQPGMRRPQKRQRNHQKRAQPRAPVVPLPRQRRQQILRRRQKRPRRTRSSETAAGQSASAAAGSKTAAALSASAASTSAGQASASATAAGKSAESAASSASTATTKAGEATEQASAAARSASAAKTSETNAKASETSAESSKTAAASSASSAASSASSASASKDEATRQASAAKGSATTASTKATEAAGSATAASQSKTTAESAATRAEAAADRAEEIAGAVAMEDASLTTKGVVKLSSAVDSTSESLAATPKAVKAANDNANSRVPSNRKVNGKALTADITLTPKDIGTLNSVTMSFSGGAGWFKLATVTMPQASSIVYIALIGGAGYNVGSPHQAGISELVLRAGNGNPKGITGALWKRTAVGLTNFAWINTSGDTYDIYVEIGNYATRVNIHWDCTANATVSIYTSPTYSASKPSSVTDGVVYTMYSSHQKPTPSDIGALPTTGGTVSGPLSVTGGLTGSLNGNASTATKLQTARSIGGVVFDGSANINLPGVNTTGNQNTTGNAATATKLQTARKISGVPFDGSTDITLTAAHVAAFARRATDAYADADGGVPWNAESGAYNVTRSGDSYILVNFYTGVGSCRTLQMKAHYRNGGLFYRSSRDGYGFEEDWAEVYTSKNLPPESYPVGAPIPGHQIPFRLVMP